MKPTTQRKQRDTFRRSLGTKSMAIRDTNTAEEYPYVFLIRQSLGQRQLTTINAAPEYTLSLSWIYYKVLEDGSIVYDHSSLETVDIEDFFTTALTAAGSGEMAHFNTLGAQQESVRLLVEAKTGRSFEVV